MKIIKTHLDNLDTLPEWEKDQVYNGLDVTATLEIYQKLSPMLDDVTEGTYNFSKSLQGPVLEMQYRGVRVDLSRREDVVEEYMLIMDQLERNLQRIVREGLGMIKFDWQSWKDQQELFYDRLGLPIQRKFGKPTTDRGARDKLSVYPVATQICKHINILADLGKKVSVLRADVDRDGRMHTSYNIAGTSTGRFSSSMSEFGTGTNLQNIEESLRSIFISDQRMKFAKFDAKSGESYCVGAIEWNLFNDPRYLDACESGDPHTAVAKLIWPALGWTGDIRRDKDLAERPFYREHTYRFMCKKLGHGSNYGGQPDALAEQAHVQKQLVAEFQPKYFSAFPSHKLWHAHVNEALRRDGYITSLMGRRCWFFGRRDDPDTYREALAYNPQSSLADIVNTAMLKLWRLGYTIVMHDHDALTFMYKEKEEDEVIPRIMEALVIPVQLNNGRELRIPYDCVVGWNKGKYHAESNPNGLIECSGHDNRTRIPEADLLDRQIRQRNRGAWGA